MGAGIRPRWNACPKLKRPADWGNRGGFTARTNSRAGNPYTSRIGLGLVWHNQ
jgi:hypothetical protein